MTEVTTEMTVSTRTKQSRQQFQEEIPIHRIGANRHETISPRGNKDLGSGLHQKTIWALMGCSLGHRELVYFQRMVGASNAAP
jgi:hypothetical protein